MTTRCLRPMTALRAPDERARQVREVPESFRQLRELIGNSTNRTSSSNRTVLASANSSAVAHAVE